MPYAFSGRDIQQPPSIGAKAQEHCRHGTPFHSVSPMSSQANSQSQLANQPPGSGCIDLLK